VVGAHAEAEPLDGGRVGLAEHERVVLALLPALEVGDVAVAEGQAQAEQLLVEVQRRVDVAHLQHAVGDAHDVERDLRRTLQQPLYDGGAHRSSSASGIPIFGMAWVPSATCTISVSQ
jgi:hypothetical protein